MGEPSAVAGVIDGVMAAAAGPGGSGRGEIWGPPPQHPAAARDARMTGHDSDPDVDYSR